jgi:hypothetical protein
VHSQVQGYCSAATSQQQQQQQQQDLGNSHAHPQQLGNTANADNSVTLLPHQLAAVTAVTSQLQHQQRILLRLPPSTDIDPVITHLVAHYAQSHKVLVLVSTPARVLALKTALQLLLNPARLSPRVVPGELIKPQDTVLLVDLQRLQQMPGASTQLLQQQTAQQGLAIYEEGFLTSSSSSSLFDDDLRSAAQQLLRQLRFLEPNPGRSLVSMSSRGWEAMLLHHATQQQQQHMVDSSSSSSTAAVSREGFELTLQQAAADRLVRPVSAVSIPIPNNLQSSCTIGDKAGTAGPAAAAAGYDPWLALCSQSSNNLIAAAVATFGNGGKALAYTSSEDHACKLSVTLNLQGISSLVLHDGQNPEDQAAVLAAFRDGPDRVMVSSLAGNAAAVTQLGCEVSCVVMAGAESNATAYAARLAPVLLPAAAAGVSGSSSSSNASRCVVVDFVSSATTAAAAAEKTGGAAGAAAGSSLTCGDVLGPYCIHLPLPAEIAALTNSSSTAAAAAEQDGTAAAAGSSSRRRRSSTPVTSEASLATSSTSTSSSSSDHLSSSLTPPESSNSFTAVRGDLVWTILDSGSWAIPIKRGRGGNMTGLLVAWLSKKPNGWVPEVEEGLGQLSALPGTSGRPLKSLQRARVSNFYR